MSFEKLLRPRSIAVIGASANPAKVGYSILKNIIDGGFNGDVYPVNPTSGEILGRTCFPSIKDIPVAPDCAVITIKRDQVLPVLKECAEKSVLSIITITAGFKETGEEGKQLQLEIARFVRQNNMTMLGPNCLGFINPWHKLNASFGQALGEPGSIAIISQSGALITAIQDMAASNKIGFSLLASLGNKATLDEVEFIQNLQRHEATSVIAAYLEIFPAGRNSCALPSALARPNPLSSSRRAGPLLARRPLLHIQEVLRGPTPPTGALLTGQE